MRAGDYKVGDLVQVRREPGGAVYVIQAIRGFGIIGGIFDAFANLGRMTDKPCGFRIVRLSQLQRAGIVESLGTLEAQSADDR